MPVALRLNSCNTCIIRPIPLVRIWVFLRIVYVYLRNSWLMRLKVKIKTLFVLIALVVMHPRALISSCVKVHILPQLEGTTCA